MSEEMPEQGKVAIVTGASRGLGRAIAIRLAREGINVALAATSKEDLDAVMTEIELEFEAGVAAGRALAVPTDITDESQVKRLVDETLKAFGRVDILINNAGIGYNGPVETMSAADWDHVVNVNLRGVFLCSREVLGPMKRQGGGNIISIGSGAGKQGYPNLAAYCASKFGLMGFSEALAAEVGEAGIKVTVALPGTIAGTDFSWRSRKGQAAPKQPGRKVVMPEDIAEAIVYLLNQPVSVRTAEMNLWPFAVYDE